MDDEEKIEYWVGERCLHCGEIIKREHLTIRDGKVHHLTEEEAEALNE